MFADRFHKVSCGHLVGNQVGVCTAEVREHDNGEAVVRVS
jgi:hypothetical protein